MRQQTQSGFTLIELVTVVAIAGILLAIAVPSYNEQVRSSRRADAKADVAQAVQCLERFHTSNRTYTGGGASCARANDFYTIAFPTLNATAFQVTAAPIAGGPQAGDKCGTFQINQAGSKTISGAKTGITAADCW